jgi:hypothetical protein
MSWNKINPLEHGFEVKLGIFDGKLRETFQDLCFTEQYSGAGF